MFVELLKKHRHAKGINQSLLARMIDVDHSYISRIESGSRPTPSREVVQNIAVALNLTDGERIEFVHAAGYLVDQEQLTLALNLHPDLRKLQAILDDPNVPEVYKLRAQEIIQVSVISLELAIEQHKTDEQVIDLRSMASLLVLQEV